ncbi:MAG: adenylosuccinate synthetase [Bacteroidales bacterium]|nr:adenylosuccinate synthetase [Bacteroidales bacterium]
MANLKKYFLRCKRIVTFAEVMTLLMKTNKETKIVLGALFGDEGKGVCVHSLCKKALDEGKHPLVVRFCGGPQAAHTVDFNGLRHIFSSFGSGTLLNVPTLYLNTALIDPICIVNEYNVLINKGITPKFNVSDAKIITPYDVEFCRNDKKTLSDGTCGKGVYAALKRSDSGKSFSLDDNPEEILSSAVKYYNTTHCKEFDEMFLTAFYKVKNLQSEININDYSTIIYEGTQGLLLDADLGFQPFVTATNTGLQYFADHELENAEVYLVMRTYLTRHGNGFTPQQVENYNLNDESESNVYNGFQGNFKTGVFDFDLLNEAFQRHKLGNYHETKFTIFLTHLDTVKRNERFIYVKDKKLHEINCQNFSQIEKLFCDFPFVSELKFYDYFLT